MKARSTEHVHATRMTASAESVAGGRRSGAVGSSRVPLDLLADAQLAAMLRTGEDRNSAEIEFLRRARRSAHAVLVKRVMRADSRDDLMQDTLFNVWRYLDRFDPQRGAFSTWVSRIADNAVNSYWRRSRCRPNEAVSLSTQNPAGGWCELVEIDLRFSIPPADTALRLSLDDYCARCSNRTEAKVVECVLGLGYRIADVKALAPHAAGSADRWIRKARQALMVGDG